MDILIFISEVNQPTTSKGQTTMTTIKANADKFFNNLDSGKWVITYTLVEGEKYEVRNTRTGKSHIVVII
jgi:hypothetical protein